MFIHMNIYILRHCTNIIYILTKLGPHKGKTKPFNNHVNTPMPKLYPHSSLKNGPVVNIATTLIHMNIVFQDTTFILYMY